MELHNSALHIFNFDDRILNSTASEFQVQGNQFQIAGCNNLVKT